MCIHLDGSTSAASWRFSASNSANLCSRAARLLHISLTTPNSSISSIFKARGAIGSTTCGDGNVSGFVGGGIDSPATGDGVGKPADNNKEFLWWRFIMLKRPKAVQATGNCQLDEPQCHPFQTIGHEFPGG